jgi:hypothetical protein
VLKLGLRQTRRNVAGKFRPGRIVTLADHNSQKTRSGPSRRALLAGALAAVGAVAASQRLLAGPDGGGKTSPRPTPPNTPLSGASTPLCGINVPEPHAYTVRRNEFGRIGVARVYNHQMLPAKWTWQADGLSDSKSAQVSFKTDPAEIAAGTHDTVIRSWLSSIPASWTIWLTFWHEPNDELRAGVFTTSDFRAAWQRLSKIVRAQKYQPGVTVYLTPVFAKYLVDTVGWSDAWVPPPSEVDLLSWDVFGNPTGGEALNSPYPSVADLVDPCLRVTERVGFKRWGVSEFNTPRRTWDPQEQARVKWLSDFRSYCWTSTRSVAPQLGSPEIFLLWEGQGSHWDLAFYTPATTNWWRGVLKQGR